MPINSACTGCGQFLSVADQHVGKQARCPSCGQIYTVPLKSTIDDLGNPLDESHTDQTAASNPFGFPLENSPSEDIPLAQLNDHNQPPTISNSDSYWMRAGNGQVYGPVDRANLDRWFREGRVGIDYQIRHGELGAWQQATLFQPPAQGYAQPAPFAATSSIAATAPYNSNAQANINPYMAASASSQPKPAYQSEKGVLVLVFGVLSWVLCFGFGIAAVAIGGQAIREIDAGRGNPNERTMIKIGYWLGLVSVILNLLGIGSFLFISALNSIGIVR